MTHLQTVLVVVGGLLGLMICVGRLLQEWSRRRAERRRGEWGRIR